MNITLIGNPNVGKSTIFNLLTGLHQHTGNWPGKTVEHLSGEFKYKGKEYNITDLPGTYSYFGKSQDEIIAADYVKNHSDDLTIVVCDATAVERGLILALQTMDICKNVIICINLMDEAFRKGIAVNTQLLKSRLKIPIIETSSKDKSSKKRILEEIHNFALTQKETKPLENSIFYVEKAEEICHGAITLLAVDPNEKDRKIDSILLGKYTSIPIMLAVLGFIFYLTITFASYPSELLSDIFDKMLKFLREVSSDLGVPETVKSVIIDGMLKVLFWVVAVMLPPMAIFFPLFTLLEDFGYLPRVAYNLDTPFKKCGTCGKQSLTMCMGLGCNCAGVTGCRIIQSPKEKLIAIITNALTPCNGKFPTIFALITMFFVVESSKLPSVIIFTVVILMSVCSTMLTSKLLSKFVFKNESESFHMELPPYRKPKIHKVLGNSVMNKILFVLSRAVCVAAPAGIIIWILSNVDIADKSILLHLTDFLDPVGKFIGLDGTILTGFILGLPANEIVIPIILMGYLAKDTLIDYSSLSELKTLLIDNGWTTLTAICTLIFTLFHWPCSTALLTIKKETASLKWTAVSMIIPSVIGFIMCFIVNSIFKLICYAIN